VKGPGPEQTGTARATGVRISGRRRSAGPDLRV